jgi:GNAT superfamily N-acetyltransferase
MSVPSPQRTADEVILVAADHPLAHEVLADLEREYTERYGDAWGEPASDELSRYPLDEFAAPAGGFLVLVRGDEVVAGGAFRRYDEETSELKRIWTSPRHRRQGLARRIVAALEDESRRRGYTTVYLTTGPLQPEAQRLYAEIGYTPLFDPSLSALEVLIHGFAKSLTEAPLDRTRIQKRHDAERAEFLAERPDAAAALRAAGDGSLTR